MSFNFRKSKVKYNNTKVEYDGIKFDSKREKDRYVILKQAEKDGTITNLVVHPKFELIPAVTEKYIKHLKTKDKEVERTIQLAITYTADFMYEKDGQTIIEDIKISKHILPKEYVLKKKMMLALKGLKVKEVYKPNEEI